MLSPVADYSPVQCFQCSWVSSINMARSSSATCKLHTHNVLRSVSPCHNCMKISVYGHIKERILSSCLKRKAKRCMHSIYNVKVQDRRKKIKIMLLFFFQRKWNDFCGLTHDLCLLGADTTPLSILTQLLFPAPLRQNGDFPRGGMTVWVKWATSPPLALSCPSKEDSHHGAEPFRAAILRFCPTASICDTQRARLKNTIFSFCFFFFSLSDL